jgi:hypothetical protein
MTTGRVGGRRGRGDEPRRGIVHDPTLTASVRSRGPWAVQTR